MVSGRLLFGLHCASCHGAALQGTAAGPALLRTPAVMVDYMIRSGRMPAAGSPAPQLMGSVTLNDAQISAIVSYVTARGRGDATLPHLAGGQPGRGRALFAENCAQCHGATARGASVGSNNVAPSLNGTAPEQIAEAVRSGPGEMPRFGTDVLSPQNVDDITAFLVAIRSPSNNAGGWSLGEVGPVAEGLIAWLFGLGLLVLFVRRVGTTD